ADREHRHACRDLPRIFFREARRFIAAVLQIVARGGEVLLDVDVLHRGLQVAHHLLADSEAPEELIQSSIWSAVGHAARRAAVRLLEACSSHRYVSHFALLSSGSYVRP